MKPRRTIPVQVRRYQSSHAPTGRLSVTCWCEAEYVWVPPAWVGERTATCGRPGCDPAHLRPGTGQKHADNPCTNRADGSTVPGDGNSDAGAREHSRASS